ncbi:hypothetical protein B4N89_47340 [Embleya scabrispora]|uniref:Uncharacterized protein n=1 Tax=Embleya scabrispora TaxID=159449 RepID=A0A1T3NHV7_9ACTN|nr:hypothetical protein [Embleya scabrispora]OPC76426.1 hypothetical protein B4N89_47340 [Embleya scabrispora]
MPSGSKLERECLTFDAGFAYVTQTFTGDGGTVATTTLNTPFSSPVTATHTRARGLPPLTVRRTATE